MFSFWNYSSDPLYQRWPPLLRYEERIIELHSVIAELSKKMEEEKDDVIKEESECDESQVGMKSNFFETLLQSKLQVI